MDSVTLRHRHALFVWTLLFLTIGIMVVITKKNLQVVHKLILVAGVSLVAMSVCDIALKSLNKLNRNPEQYEQTINKGSLIEVGLNENVIPKENEPLLLPDIYHIILDAYVGSSVLRKYFDFENEEIEKYLEKNGFFVAKESYSNYAYTTASLASSLNMQYLDEFLLGIDEGSKDIDILNELVRGNKLVRILREKGYRIIEIGKRQLEADESHYLKDSDKIFFKNIFRKKLWEHGSVLRYLPVVPQKEHKNNVIWIFDELERVRAKSELDDENTSVYVFAHILCPHTPFVFGPDGENVSVFDVFRYGPKRLYTRQIEYVNKLVRRFVQGVIGQENGRRKIIIIQGDHGINLAHSGLFIDEVMVENKMSIFNAVHAPDAMGGMYSSMSPVNTFRLIRQEYFGEDIELLEDRSYFSDYSDPYGWTDVSGLIERE